MKTAPRTSPAPRARLLLAALAAAALGSACAEPPREQPEHVLLVVIDTLRADHLGVMGYRRPTSPRIDELASRGVVCTQAIAQAAWTSPSMISLMTGRYIGRERLDIPEDLATLAETFAAGGWSTGGFASNELISAENGFARGFERFEWIDEHGSNEAIERWLADVGERRSLTYVHITEPHDPYQAPPDRTRWRTEGGLLPGDRAAYYDQVAREMGVEVTDAMRAQVETEIGGYDDEVLYADGRVGALLDAFERAGRLEDTLVVVTSDHGEGLWERVAMWNGPRGLALQRGEEPTLLNTLQPTHGSHVTRELVRVPLVLAGPGLPRGVPLNSVVELLDIYPTLLELAGLRPAPGLHGQSLLRRLDGSERVKEHAFSYTRFNLTVIDSEGWSLILPTDEGRCAENLETQLYLLGDDPHQRHDLAEEEPEIVARLRRVAEQRLGIAITSAGTVSQADMEAFRQLGYVGEMAREEDRQRFAGLPVEQVVEQLARPQTPCTERLLAAESLVGRELDEASRARLVDWRDHMETSAAVQRVLAQVLGR